MPEPFRPPSLDPIADDQRRVVNRFRADFDPFPGGSGDWVLQLDETGPPGVGFHLYRMEPGAVTTPHEHTADEQFLVLEGELIDHDGHVYRPGDLVLLRAGTRHWSRTETGCELAVFIATAERNL